MAVDINAIYCDIDCAFASLAIRESRENRTFTKSERCALISKALSHLLDDDPVLDKNRFVLHALLSRCWQLNQSPQNSVDYHAFPNALKLMSTEFYVSLIESLDLSYQFKKALYGLPNEVVIRYSSVILECTPQFLVHVHVPILNIVKDQPKADTLTFLKDMWRRYGSNISGNNPRTQISVFDETVKVFEGIFSNNSISSDSMIKALKESDDHVVGWAVHSDSEPRRYLYTASQRERWAERYRILSSPSFFKKFLLETLSLVHSMLDVFTSDNQAQGYFSVAMEGSMTRFIRAIREISVFDELKTENEVKRLLTYEEWMRNKPNRTTRKTRQERISRCLEADASQLPSPRLATGVRKLHPLVQITRKIHSNLDIHKSLPMLLDGIRISFEDTEECVSWLLDCIKHRRMGCMTFLKVVVDFVWMFVGRSDFDSDHFLSLMIEQGLSLDLYKSIDRLSKSYRSNPSKISNDTIKNTTALFLKLFSNLTIHQQQILRDYVVSNREKALDITFPTFGNWDLWDYDFERRGRVVCNQLVAGDDEDSEILEAVMELSLISPYQTLDLLVMEATRNKGQSSVIIHLISQTLASITSYKSHSTSPTLLIAVLQNRLQKIKLNIVILSDQERKNLITFILGSISSELISKSEAIRDIVIPELETNTQNLPVVIGVLVGIINNTTEEKTWLWKTKPFLMLILLGRILSARSKSVSALSVIENVERALDFIIAQIKVAFETEKRWSQDDINANETSMREFYEESSCLSWSFHLRLYSLFDLLSKTFNFKLIPPPIPKPLYDFLSLSSEEFTATGSEFHSIISKIMLFLEACRIEDTWCTKFCEVALVKSPSDFSVKRRNFLKLAPVAFCSILDTSTESEAIRLLTQLVKTLIGYGLLSASDLVSNCGVLVGELEVQDRLSLACIRFSMINILSGLSTLAAGGGTHNMLQRHSMNDLYITQNIIKSVKKMLSTSSSITLLVLVFHTTSTTLARLGSLPRSEEQIYIFLLFIVENLTKDNGWTLQRETKEVVDDGLQRLNKDIRDNVARGLFGR
ncbi:310_t:CDS:10 [Paraglomus brasilianum]|uniref:310_t:CDS:1 n=1 Tax=Paraglomus brasilianum TaxID=144538 RepID=A0A9N8W429_9GLOM|nr:310_t:CDS:10 [Paraglomus brasilianum]